MRTCEAALRRALVYWSVVIDLCVVQTISRAHWSCGVPRHAPSYPKMEGGIAKFGLYCALIIPFVLRWDVRARVMQPHGRQQLHRAVASTTVCSMTVPFTLLKWRYLPRSADAPSPLIFPSISDLTRPPTEWPRQSRWPSLRYTARSFSPVVSRSPPFPTLTCGHFSLFIHPPVWLVWLVWLV